MAIVPPKDSDALNFFECHWGQWQSHAADLGIPEALAEDVRNDVIEARSRFRAAQIARDAARSATSDWNSAMTRLRTQGAAAIAAIKAKASDSAAPNAVYALAMIPPPSPGSPRPLPGTPDAFSSALRPSGAVFIKWKMPGIQPGNTFYQVARRLPGEAVFTFIGGSDNKTFLDETLPAGIEGVEYQVTAVRGSAFGRTSNTFSVRFGVRGPRAAKVKLAG